MAKDKVSELLGLHMNKEADNFESCIQLSYYQEISQSEDSQAGERQTQENQKQSQSTEDIENFQIKPWLKPKVQLDPIYVSQ